MSFWVESLSDGRICPVSLRPDGVFEGIFGEVGSAVQVIYDDMQIPLVKARNPLVSWEAWKKLKRKKKNRVKR